MALSINKSIPALLMMIAIMMQFSPQLFDAQRSIGSSVFWCVAIILNFMISPPNLGERPPRVIWSERDGGEQFSIVMFHLLLLGASFFIAYQIALEANSLEGAKWMNILAAIVAASGIWLVWKNWKNRNAR